MIKGELVYLRALEPDDLDFIYEVENNTDIWELSETQTPYSRYVIKRYLENVTQDIYEAKQLRLAICHIEDGIIGLIDLFDFSPKNKRAGVGIIINQEKHRNKGFAKEALALITNYCFEVLHLHQLYANIEASNAPSLNLFEHEGFVRVGLKKDWSFDGMRYHDEYLLQKIKTL